MDEPFAALDAQLRAVMQEELLDLWQTDRRTVLFVTHSLEEAILLSDRVAVMSARPGQLLESVERAVPRPRYPEIRSTPEFAALHGGLWEMLRGEVERHLARARRRDGADPMTTDVPSRSRDVDSHGDAPRPGELVLRTPGAAERDPAVTPTAAHHRTRPRHSRSPCS